MHLTSILWSDNIPKKQIKEDDDLRSYVNQGLLDGIRKFDPKRGSKFIYFAHIWMKKIYFGEASYRFIRIPVNQKVFYDSHVKERAAAELLNSEHTVTVKIHGVRKYKDRFFHRFSNIRCRVWFAGAQSIYYTRQTSKPSTKTLR
jgi:hypothetical protein